MPIPTKFCTAIRTTKYSLWIVQTRMTNVKIAISQQLVNRSRRNLLGDTSLTLLTFATPKISTFLKSKMAAAAILKNRHISTLWRMLILLTLLTIKKIKFSNSKVAAANTAKNRIITLCQKPFDWLPLNLTQFEPLDPCDRRNFHILKIQDGGGRHFQKLKYCHISRMVWSIVTKFGTVMHVDPLDLSDC